MKNANSFIDPSLRRLIGTNGTGEEVSDIMVQAIENDQAEIKFVANVLVANKGLNVNDVTGNETIMSRNLSAHGRLPINIVINLSSAKRHDC